MNVTTKHCSQCGLVATADSTFCVQCGFQFPPAAAEPSSYVCEECETLLPCGSRYCPCCGIAFDTPVPAVEQASISDLQQPLPHRRRILSGNDSASVLSTPSALGAGGRAATAGLSSLSGLNASKSKVLIVGTLLAVVFFAAGFGLIQLAHPQSVTAKTDDAASVPPPEKVSVTPAIPAVVPMDHPLASEPPAVQDDTPRNDVSEDSLPRTLNMPDPSPEMSSSNHAASADDTMTAYAPPGSGLSDVPLSIDTLRNEAVTSDDLKNLSLRALSISHNSIYALHGYIFERPAIQAYFNAQSWYHSDPAFNHTMLTNREQQNGQTIRAAERANFDYGRHMFDEQGRPYEQSHPHEHRDPLRETAAPGSGLDDTLIDLNTLQNTVIASQDLTGKSLAALSISYNAIYAAHGYVFKKASLQQLFSHAAWYHPNPAFRETDLTFTERANLQTIRSYERSRFGY